LTALNISVLIWYRN